MKYDITVHRIVRLKKGDHQYIEKHSHPFFHYIYVLNGRGKIIVNGNIIFVGKYDLVMNSPGVEHEIFGMDRLTCLDIKFSCDQVLTEMLSSIGYYIKEVSAYEDSLIRDIFDEAVNSREYFEHIINTRMLELLFNILRRKKAGIQMIDDESPSKSFPYITNKSKAEKVKEILVYIESNMSEPLRVSDIAAQMGYNETYFSTFFKECTGYTPCQYINIMKVEKAKEFILYTSYNITEISEKLGFETVHYFSKVFKKIVGISPANYMSRAKINMTINVVKDSVYLPKGEYEIPMRDVGDKGMVLLSK